MHISFPGHVYQLTNRVVTNDANVGSYQTLGFVQNEPPLLKSGVTSQEVLRALIDRSKYVQGRLPHPTNRRILEHLRMALILHESRALERKVLKGLIEEPEYYPVGDDGHLILRED